MNVDIGNISPYALGRVIEFWYLFSLNIGKDKKLHHASTQPTGSTYANVTETKNSMDALMNILDVAYKWEDDSLVLTTLASMRHHVVHGRIEAMDCVDAVKRAYVTECVNDKHQKLQKRILLAAALCIKSSMALPGAVRSAFVEAIMECPKLNDD